MRKKPIISNWTLMIAYTVVLFLGIIAASFLLAFSWNVDFIDRVNPVAANYRAEHTEKLPPLSSQIVR